MSSRLMKPYIPMLALLSGCATLQDSFRSAPRPEPVADEAVREPSSLPTDANRSRQENLFEPRAKSPDYNFSCKELNELLAATQPSTVEEVLAGIRKARPKFLTQTTYVYQTLTNDDASTIYPRTVVFGGDAKTVLAFNGHPKQRGYERLETMCFDESESRFDFLDIVFPKEAPAPEALTDLTEEEKAAKYVTIPGGRGMRECKRCHETPSRPNWDVFALWPGIYGSVEDSIRNPVAGDQRPIYSEFEWKRWKLFARGRGAGRYRHTSQESARPNSDFTALLGYLNGRRIVGDLKRAGERFEPLKYEFAKALFCAPKAERRFFRQLNFSSSDGATFAVLPANAGSETREIFLSAYFDQMAKERRLLGVLKDFNLAQPFPKERFEELRAYYRS
ncbi:MAG: hypothetical protein HC902_09690, partial [Calothrix sp. SM1_5_4]|nr:hypothetical protein [Calothrix sp. SM1_5_4]